MFIVQDPYGMDKFISNVRIITEWKYFNKK
jgi:hypothetical protein